MEVLPVFKSHFSIGRSILTLEDEEISENDPDSIIDIAKKNNIKDLFLIEDNMSSFLQAYTNTKKNNINLRYGLRLSINDNIEDKTEESRSKTSKVVILFKTNEGYTRLIKIFTEAAKNGFYYEPRIDYKTLEKMWSDNDLMLCIPFYDSFIFNNTLKNFICVPNFNFTKPVMLLENNCLPFNFIIKEKVIKYAEANKLEVLNVKSVYYKTKKDFKSYLTFRCINNRTTLNKPELNHMSSDEFSFEAWKEQVKC
jgi:DNA polymerase-3 subunit alpha